MKCEAIGCSEQNKDLVWLLDWEWTWRNKCEHRGTSEEAATFICDMVTVWPQVIIVASRCVLIVESEGKLSVKERSVMAPRSFSLRIWRMELPLKDRRAYCWRGWSQKPGFGYVQGEVSGLDLVSPINRGNVIVRTYSCWKSEREIMSSRVVNIYMVFTTKGCIESAKRIHTDGIVILFAPFVVPVMSPEPSSV